MRGLLKLVKELAARAMAVDTGTGEMLGSLLRDDDHKKRALELSSSLLRVLREKANGLPLSVVNAAIADFVVAYCRYLEHEHGLDAEDLFDTIIITAWKLYLIAEKPGEIYVLKRGELPCAS